MKMLGIILFMLLPLIGITYLGWHIWCLLPLRWFWRVLLIVLMAGSFLLMFFMRGGLDRMPMSLATVVYEVSTSSIFVMLYMVLAFLVLDLGRIVRLVPRHIVYDNWWTAGTIALLMVVVFVYGNKHYYHKHRQQLTIQSAKVTKPLRLVMVSDLHLGYHNRRNELHRWVDLINREKPDLILIAGDIIDMSMRPLRDEKMFEEFQRLSAPVYACLGNHEYYSGEPEAQRFIYDAGIHLLQDETATVGDLCIIGRDDRTNQRRLPLDKLMQKVSATTQHPSSTPHHPSPKFTILLDHQPYHLEKAEQAGIDFQFSGHTHYGQVWPISWITDAIYECAFGSHQRGNTRYYISSGLGIWGGKFRIGTRSEYVVMDIKP